jgi:hypothetical protein
MQQCRKKPDQLLLDLPIKESILTLTVQQKYWQVVRWNTVEKSHGSPIVCIRLNKGFDVNIDTLIDNLLIEEVIARLAQTHDDKDWEGFAALLASEVRVDLSEYLGIEPMEAGAQDVTNRLAEVLNGFDSTHHTVSDILLTVAGNDASVRNHITAYFHLSRPEGAVDHCVMRGTWTMRLHKVDDRWLINEIIIKRTTPWEGDPELFVYAIQSVQQR